MLVAQIIGWAVLGIMVVGVLGLFVLDMVDPHPRESDVDWDDYDDAKYEW